jgi:hypothetical protein
MILAHNIQARLQCATEELQSAPYPLLDALGSRNLIEGR